MKVIKKGEPTQIWSKKFKCTGFGNNRKGCGAILLVDEKDLFKTTRCLMDGSTITYVSFKCCQCKALTDIDNDEKVRCIVPDFIWKKLKIRNPK